MPLSVGMFIPRGVGDPRGYGPPSHKAIVRHGQMADEFGFVSPNEADAARVVEQMQALNGAISVEEVHKRYVLGTPDRVVAGLRQLVDWGINHLIVSHGPQPSCLWSEATLELFAREVLPALRAG